VIKSGGEWISSLDLENAIMAHPGVAEATVVGLKHPTWQERPVAFVVPKPGAEVDARDVLEFLQGKVAKWWLPDRVVTIDAIPKTGTGKFDKKVVRRNRSGGPAGFRRLRQPRRRLVARSPGGRAGRHLDRRLAQPERVRTRPSHR
jgi:acyl-CoA synthetase (AMP-forming)/AMP-acid ligase II